MKSTADLKVLLGHEPGLTLAVAESVTCGRLQSRVGEIPGASGFFLGGLTAYSLTEKVRHLGVDPAAAAAVDSVSAGIASQMARGVAALFGADVGVATTGYAEPDPAKGVLEPLAFWALARRLPANAWLILTGKIVCPGAKRVAAQSMLADAVLAELAAHLRAVRGG